MENPDLNPDVKKDLNKIAEREGYREYEIHTRTISTDGGNYLGVLYEIDIKGETVEGSKETNLFVKHIDKNLDNNELLSFTEVYLNESFVYTELATIFTELQNESGVPPDERFNMVPSYDVSTNDAIILENMTKKGFKTYDRMGLMSLQYAKLCVQQLAMFHGLSFVIEKRMPEYFEKRIKTMKKLLAAATPQIAAVMYDKVTNKLTTDSKNKIDKCWNNILEIYPTFFDGAQASVKCLCHGDFKMNNVLFKEIEGEVTKVIPIDFQLVNYGSPIIDFIFFIFIATDREFRRNHLGTLKDEYHGSLKKFLQYFDISAEEIYPREMFDANFGNCLFYGLVNGVVTLPFLFINKDEEIDMQADDLENMRFTLDNSFYERLQGIIDDFIEWGYL